MVSVRVSIRRSLSRGSDAERRGGCSAVQRVRIARDRAGPRRVRSTRAPLTPAGTIVTDVGPGQTVQLRRFTRSEYEQMVDVGVLGPDDRVELIDGEIVVISPEKSHHAAVIDLVADTLRESFGPGRTVRIQHPLALGIWSEPEPDVCVVEGTPRDHLSARPTSALLVVEVSDSSLAFDQTSKARLYAAAGLAEYCIVNLVEGCVEVRRDPVDGDYATVSLHHAGETLTPLACPAARIPVASLLP